MNEKKYTEDGDLIVSEFDKCPLWEKSTQPCSLFCSVDCFFANLQISAQWSSPEKLRMFRKQTNGIVSVTINRIGETVNEVSKVLL